MKSTPSLAYLLIGYGVRDLKRRKMLLGFAAEFQKSVPGRKVATVFFRPTRSSVQQGITSCIKAGAGEIVVLPVGFSPGHPPKEAIPQEIQAAKRRFPKVDFHYAGVRGLAGEKN